MTRRETEGSTMDVLVNTVIKHTRGTKHIGEYQWARFSFGSI